MKKTLLLAMLLMPFTTFASDSVVEELENQDELQPVVIELLEVIRPDHQTRTVPLSWQAGRSYSYRYEDQDITKQIGDNKIQWAKKRNPRSYGRNCVYGVPYDYKTHFKSRMRSGFERSNGYCRNYQDTEIFAKRQPIIYTRNVREVRVQGTDVSILNFQKRYDLELSGKAKLLKLLGIQY